MIFGDHVHPAGSAAPARWIADACRERWWTVAGLVPDRYPSFLRIHAPAGEVADWWAAYRHLFAVVSEVGERHTSTPGRAWFAVWEGHGFGHDPGLAPIPRLHLQHRTYYLLTGPVHAAPELEYPGEPGRWHNPDLFWPDDRRWFVATDVDFWSLYVGGDDGFLADLAAAVPTPNEPVDPDLPLEAED